MNSSEDISFKAYVVDEIDGEYIASIKQRKISELPEGELLVKVCYSSLNYKDALSISGNKGVTRHFPHTPGIDAVGEVVSDSTGQFQSGDQVIVTSYDLGMDTDGGFAEYIRVPTSWAVALPQGLSLKESMILGTAGLTAAQSVAKIVESVAPEDGDILVTGATGGVGSLSVAILSHLGYSVTALTGKKTASEFLMSLGAAKVIDRNEFLDVDNRVLLKPKWAGVVDCVGGDVLVTAIKEANPLSVITCCGMVAATDLPLTIFPFILRGVSLVGIDSQHCPMELRKKLWALLADKWKPKNLLELTKTVSLENVDASIKDILQGQMQGRTLIKIC